ncbi:type IV secretory system conjugative DNA transfer family protein [Patescibacteria group bacterium]|nr:type IV secretory system conjugative DNA transfer family protein [Patescibacteria group bacterium]MBU1889951.1 type IV secretory system conjugative DNA transfer family protein [Patescibacteria group bacterium]
MIGVLVTLPAATETDTTFGIASGESLLFNIFLIIGAVIVLIVLLFLVRKIFIYSGRMPSALRRTILLVTVPKEHMELEEKSDRPQGGIKELMGVSEALYANFGGVVRQQKWYSRLIFGRQDHISLEIVANQGYVSFYFVTPDRYKEFVEQQIQAQYPDAEVQQVEDYNIFSPSGVIRCNYLKLIKRSMFPIRTYQKLETDPMNALTNVLSQIKEPEGAAIQILIRPAPKRWQSGALEYSRRVVKGKGEKGILEGAMGGILSSAVSSKEGDQKELEKERMYRMSPVEEEKIKAVGEKVSKLGFETNIRVIVSASDSDRAQVFTENIINSFSQYSSQEVGNSFRRIRVLRKGRFIRDFIYRHFRSRYRYVLNTEELTSIFHLPLSNTETPNIRWSVAKHSAPPVELPNEGIILGVSHYRGKDLLVRLKEDDRRRHLYTIGKSGTGKSVFLTNLAVQDIKNGKGVCVVDPHGDLIEDILGQIPEERVDDVIIFNPSDMDRPVGLNMLEASSPEEKDFAVQEMIAIFYKLFPPEMIGPMFEHNMRNVMLTLMSDLEHPGTIVEIPRMFTDPVFQKERLKKVTDPVVRSFWEKEMAKTTDFHKSEMLGYLISKVGRFVENEMMRNIIGQSCSGFDFKEIMNNKKILLVNLSKGKTGEVNSSLLGLIIVSKLQMAALSRADVAQEERSDFYLYIDEFQNFITDSIATILSEARKYRLNLTIAHQYIGQLVENNDTKIRDAVLGNAGTIVAFKIGVEDSEIVSKIFAPVFNDYDVLNIEKYNAYIKLLVDNQPTRAFNFATIPPMTGNRELAERIKELSRTKYGHDKKQVESEIAERGRLGMADASAVRDFGSEPKV